MSTLKHLNLTEQDFQMIVDGLEQLPHRNDMGEMMGELLVGVFAKDGDESAVKMKSEREQRMKKAQDAKKQIIEDVRVLQGKLIMLKRYLIEQNALSQATDIINHIS